MAGVRRSGLKRKLDKEDEACNREGDGVTVHTEEEEELKLMARKRLKLEDGRMQLEAELEKEDPLGIVPEVVMRDVLVKLFDRPEDKVNLSLASPSAAKALMKTKAKWFFHKILPIPHLLQFFSPHELLVIRQVYRDWREAVDTYVEGVTARHSVTLSPLLSHKAGQQSTLSLKPRLTYCNQRRLVELVQEVPPVNPFISRRASFTCTSSEVGGDEQNYWSSVLSLLDKFGRELRSVSIFYNSRHTSPFSVFKTLHECLRRMPLLTELSCWIWTESRGRMRGPLRCPEMPPLPNLTRLDSWIEAPFRLQSQIFSRYYGQLVALNASLMGNSLKLYKPRIHSTFPKLKYLSVKVDEEGHDQFLFKLMSVTGPLQQVSIECDLKVPLSPGVFFHVLAPFRETLSDLKITQRFYCTTIGAGGQDHSPVTMKTLEAYGLPEPDSFDLPHLKTLVMNIPDCGYGCYDTLLKLKGSPLKNLEIFVIGCHAWRRDMARPPPGINKLELWELRSNMYATDIWGLMPDLQELNMVEGYTFQTGKPGNRRYSREGLKIFQAQAGLNAVAFASLPFPPAAADPKL